MIDPQFEPDTRDKKGIVTERKMITSAKFKNEDVKYVLPFFCKSAVVFAQRKQLKYSIYPGEYSDVKLFLEISFGVVRKEPQKILGLEIMHGSLK
ncbi:conserved hypothetical protein [Candidatus Liberibacter solanacearum]|uniref:hypothetical protein n=1 Tax=Candidatus Liberibacter solanacearum TaxID=556287 RepID=UPI00387258F2